VQQLANEEVVVDEEPATSTEVEVDFNVAATAEDEVAPFIEEVQVVEGVASIAEVPTTSKLVAAKQYWQHGCEVPSLRQYL
jgi:hypothetical protein